MNKQIQSIVSECPRLRVQENKGERHRIMRGDISRGSLWVTPRKNDFRVLVSGEVDPVLTGFLREKFRQEVGADQGKKYWHIGDIHKVARIIRYFGER